MPILYVKTKLFFQFGFSHFFVLHWKWCPFTTQHKAEDAAVQKTAHLLTVKIKHVFVFHLLAALSRCFSDVNLFVDVLWEHWDPETSQSLFKGFLLGWKWASFGLHTFTQTSSCQCIHFKSDFFFFLCVFSALKISAGVYLNNTKWCWLCICSVTILRAHVLCAWTFITVGRFQSLQLHLQSASILIDRKWSFNLKS